MPVKLLREFFKLEAAGGILLGLTALLAIVMSNSPLQGLYNGFNEIPVEVQIGALELKKPLLLWINDGLMAIFFLLVGLEIKREILQGQLSTRQQITLPAIAALGGLTIPALIYTAFNHTNPDAMNGWAIPTATDIAFALGIIMLLGKRVPEALKVTLVAIAIIDDLAAILIIALFYTSKLSIASLMIGVVCIIGLILLNLRGVRKIGPYMLIGTILWVCVLKSGVHATLAGVIIALTIPMNIKHKDEETGTEKSTSPLLNLEHDLHPWVAYMILPLFAFANAGVSLKGLSLETLFNPITLGIALGLFFGKQIGVMLFTFIGQIIGLCRLPTGVSWLQYYAMALITGVGFTMSLFIGTLAFDDPSLQTNVRLGVILGSLAAGILGFVLLKATTRQPE